jgi:FkbM family methyltransferase
MNPRFKQMLKRLFGAQIIAIRAIRSHYRYKDGVPSYSQEGEDRILAALLIKLDGGPLPGNGCYIDVGAHDPFRFSNTYLFYKQGWCGINIDAAPGSMRRFATHRPRDINLEIGVGRERSSATFFVFNEPALNTFDEGLARARSHAPWQITAKVPVEVMPLREILARHLRDGRRIDIMSIDVEGRDMEVLRSNDWSKFRPRILVVEILGKSFSEAAEDPIAVFLRERNYAFFSKTVNTAIFVDRALLSSN